MVHQLAEGVANALKADGRITSKHIHVWADGGSVVLTGVVDSLAEFGIVQDVVEAVPGVRSLTNSLQIDAEVDTGPCCPQM